MSFYKEAVRTTLSDPKGDILSLIVETNIVSWKLYATHRADEKPPSEITYSGWWSFTDRTRAMEAHKQKVDEAVALGWVVENEIKTEIEP